MNERRDADERLGSDGSAPGDAGPESLERELLVTLLREEPELAAAVEVLPAALEPVDLPTGAWERLAAALVELVPPAHDAASAVMAAALPDQAAGAAAMPPTRTVTAAGSGTMGDRRTLPRSGPRSGWNWTHPFTWLSAAAVAAVVIGLGTWGLIQTGERARLSDEQRILAYWMANPDLRMVSLQAIGTAAPAGEAGQSGRLGVVCILPDGRALLLQPTPAGRGKSYVVVGSTADPEAAQTVLGSGAGNVIRFELAGAERVVVLLASADGERVPIAWAGVN